MLIGQRYELQEQIGSGGMGAVFRGLDTLTGQLVAIKHLKPEAIASEAGMIERFNREGEALRQLNHPNIVKMITALQENDSYYLVLEYMGGGDLRDLLKREPLSIPQTLEIALDLADALTRAHRLNIIHRDLKPANVLIADDGTPRLTDFGVASLGNLERVTENNLIVGTLDYLAPEALNGLRIDTRADIWAFGVMLFEMLAGKRPFGGELFSQVMSAILLQPTPDLEELRPDAPAGLVDLVYRMLEKDREARISSVRLVGAELESIQSDKKMVGVRSATALPTVRDEDPATTVGEKRFETPASITSDRPKHNLPAQTTPFVGREGELAEVGRLLNDSRLVTILAAGGMGKTRLSLEAAAQQLERFPNGAYFVALAPLTSADNIISAVAEAVSFQFYPGGEPKQQLMDFLREKQLLLVMDNFEHLMDGVGVVQDILQAAPDVQIIVTSRQRLNLSGETLFNLEGMDFPDWETPEDALRYSAVQLFMQSAWRARPNFELKTDDLNFVARICRLVRGMPLGILLAAAWVDALSLKEIVEQINKSLDFLETEMADVPKRQRSIRAVFEYSWNLLSEHERLIFSKLSVFRGGFTREAAQAVSDAGLRQLTALVNKSLLRRDPDTGRYEVHELLRQYAEEYLEKSGIVETIRDTHSAYFAAFMQQREPDLKGKRQQAAVQEIETEFDNIRQAWHVSVQQRDITQVGKFLFSLNFFANYRGKYVEITVLLAQAVQALNDLNHAIYGRLLTYYGRSIENSGHLQESETQLRQGLAIAQEHHDELGIALASLFLARAIYPGLMKREEGVQLSEASISIYERLGDEYELANALHYRGFLLGAVQKNEESLSLYRQILEIRRQLGDELGVASSLNNIAATLYFMDSPETEVRSREVVALYKQLNQPFGVALSMSRLAEIEFSKNNLGAARKSSEEALRIAWEIGAKYLIPDISLVIVWQDIVSDQFLEAEKKLGELTNIEYIDMLAYFALAQGLIRLGLDDWKAAKSKLLTYLKFVWENQSVVYSACIAGMGFVKAHEGHIERGLEFVSWAIQDMTPNHAVAKMPLMTRQIQGIRDRLTNEAYVAAWERGKALNIENVVVELLKESE